MTPFPSIQSILSVTGTIDIDKFNRGFEENKEVDQGSLENISSTKKLDIFEEDIRSSKRLRTESFSERPDSRKPVSLWFKKQLVLKSIMETKMDLSAYGYTGETSCLPVCLLTSRHPAGCFCQVGHFCRMWWFVA